MTFSLYHLPRYRCLCCRRACCTIDSTIAVVGDGDGGGGWKVRNDHLTVRDGVDGFGGGRRGRG